MAPIVEQAVKRRKSARTGALGLLLAVILLKPFSNLFLAWGMRSFPDALFVDPAACLRVVTNPFIAVGIAMQILWLLMRMALLSVEDLSFVLPVTAVGYVLSTILARVCLHEQVSVMRWLGTGVIFLGTALVSFTMRRDVNA